MLELDTLVTIPTVAIMDGIVVRFVLQVIASFLPSNARATVSVLKIAVAVKVDSETKTQKTFKNELQISIIRLRHRGYRIISSLSAAS